MKLYQLIRDICFNETFNSQVIYNFRRQNASNLYMDKNIPYYGKIGSKSDFPEILKLFFRDPNFKLQVIFLFHRSDQNLRKRNIK